MATEKMHVNNSFQMDDGTENVVHNSNTFKTALDLETVDVKPSNGENNKWSRIATQSAKYLIHVVVGVYFAYAIYYFVDKERNECSTLSETTTQCGIRMCTGFGMLVLILGVSYLGLFYRYVLRPKFGTQVNDALFKPLDKWWMHISHTRIANGFMFLILVIALITFLYFETRNQPQKLIGLTAPIFFIFTGYVFSTNRKAINWRMVITGIAGQFLLCVFCVRWDIGRAIFQCFGDKVTTFLTFTNEGSNFIYGKTLVAEGIFYFAVMPVVIFVSFCVSLLYYVGAMQWFIMKLGTIISVMLGTTICESVIAGANIFLGMTESPLLIRPYIKVLTKSEIHAIMVSGFATVSGTVLAAYLSFGASAANLLTSSVMAAPAALAFAKLYYPETEESKTTRDNITLEKSEDSSLLDAATSGANNGVPLVLGVTANIICFIAFVALLNANVAWLAALIGFEGITFEWIFSKIFIPLAWAMGIPYKDCDVVAKVIATKTIINEFVAYERLGAFSRNGDIDARSTSIATFAICGFANPSALGILIGGLSTLAPTRRRDIASVAWRAFVVGSIVCFVSASFAGILLQDEVEKQTYSKIYNDLFSNNTTSTQTYV